MKVASGNPMQHMKATPERSEAAAGARSEAAKSSYRIGDKIDFSKVSDKGVNLASSREASPERLAQLKSLIEAGSYQVPATDVAARMVSFYSRA